MESRSIEAYLSLGSAMRFMIDFNVYIPVHGDGWLVSTLASCVDKSDNLELVNTARALRQEFNPLLDEMLKVDAPDGHASEDLARKVSEAAHFCQRVMLLEATGMRAFIARDNRYDVNRLLDTPETLLGEGVFAAHSDLVQLDLVQACRALAFEMGTAAAFHLMRATERALHELYTNYVRQNRIPEPRMWAAMTKDLSSRRTKPSDELLAHLDHIRAAFRNPTQHPEKFYTLEEAEDLLGLCTDVLGRMVRERRR